MTINHTNRTWPTDVTTKLSFSVTVSAEQVRYFNSTWPCSPIPVEPITFHYQGTDLVDITSETPSETFDGDALLALSYDAAKGYGRINRGEDDTEFERRQRGSASTIAAVFVVALFIVFAVAVTPLINSLGVK